MTDFLDGEMVGAMDETLTGMQYHGTEGEGGFRRGHRYEVDARIKADAIEVDAMDGATLRYTISEFLDTWDKPVMVPVYTMKQAARLFPGKPLFPNKD